MVHHPSRAWTMDAASSSEPWNEPDHPLDSDEETAENSPQVAAREFLQILLGLYTSSRISAEHFATLCWYADKCGMSHVGEYACAPGKKSGHYQRFLNKPLGYELSENRATHWIWLATREAKLSEARLTSQLFHHTKSQSSSPPKIKIWISN